MIADDGKVEDEVLESMKGWTSTKLKSLSTGPEWKSYFKD